MALTKEALLSRGKVKEIELPGGDTVFIKELPSSFFISPGSGKGKKSEDRDTGGAAQIAASLCDADGALMFDAKEADAVLAIPLGDFKHLIQEIMLLNGLEPVVAQADAAAPTEAEKN